MGDEGSTNFCGSALWDTNLTWYTTPPDLTTCFQNTVLLYVPCGFIWLFLLPYCLYLHGLKGKTKPIPVNKLNTAKTVIGLFLIFDQLVDVFKTISEIDTDENPPRVLLVTPLILTATFIVTTALHQVERIRGLITSGVLFIFWLLLTLAGIVQLYSKIKSRSDHGEFKDLYRFVTFCVYYFFVVLQFILSCIADPKPRDEQDGERPCPEIYASFLSYLTFWWINKLIITGYRKSLEASDLWDLNPRDLSKNNAPVFERTWQQELEHARLKARGKFEKADEKEGEGKSLRSYPNKSFGPDGEKTPLLNGTTSRDDSYVTFRDGQKMQPKKPDPSLVKVLAKCYLPTLLKAHACKLVYDILTFVAPMLQNLLISYTEDTTIEEWKGYIYASLFFVNALVQSFFFHQLFHIGMTLGMRVKSSLIAAVYKKALTMDNDARKSSTVGEIVNLMSVDAQRMQDVTGYLWMFWSAPLQIGLALWLLYEQLEGAIFAGLAIMILLIPVNGFIASRSRKYQIEQLKQKDARIKLMNEVLNGMKVLKLYAWELSFKQKIADIREKELIVLRKNAYLQAVSSFTWTCAPFLVTLATFATYVLIDENNILTANKAFVSLSLFNILRFPINLLPMMIAYIVQASVSVKRLSKFLQCSDLDTDSVEHDPTAAHAVTVENATFSWGKDEKPVLSNINLKIPDGSLVAVVGQVGTGKSSLISGMLGDMDKKAGRVNVRGSVAYVPQQAWIQNATLKDNILFGRRFKQDRYDSCIEACALKPDLDILPGGDKTEIGEKGINLSGGQKQRVSLARAVYNDADIYYFDDPLSAVDSHVGKHIFEKVIGSKGLLRKKTRVLVTHGIHWLPFVDQIIVLSDGRISETGSYDELLSHNGAFAQFLKTYLTQEDQDNSDEEEDDDETTDLKEQILQRLDSVLSDDGQTSGDELKQVRQRRKSFRTSSPGSEAAMSPGVDKQDRKRRLSRQKSMMEEAEELKKNVEKKQKEKLIEEEKSETGGVKMAVYFAYAKAIGVFYALVIIVSFAFYQGASVFSSVWLSMWTEDETLQNASLVNTTDYKDKEDLYLAIYGVAGVGQAVFVLLYALISANSMVIASRGLHAAMLHNLLRSPMEFFDTTPSGRIVNRCSRDVETVDNQLPLLLRSWMNTFYTVISTIVVISYSTPIFLAVVVPLTILYYFIQRFYIPTSRQLKRVESTTRSPIYTHFSETISGASTIRAYGESNRFIRESEHKVDHNLGFYFAGIASNRWIGLRLDFIGNLVIMTAALFTVLEKGDGRLGGGLVGLSLTWLGFRLEFIGNLIVLAAALFAALQRGNGRLSGGLVGLSISYALQVTSSLNWMVRMTSDLETNIVSVERIKEYTETPTEAEWYDDDTKPDPSWPQNGHVEVRSYSTRYRAGLDLVLRQITCSVKSGEKVGIVGRTGAGKSSLTLSLFRLIEAAGGSIVIDNIDIARLGLHELRAKLTILPQDPVLFSGTLRMNLDPFDQYTDDQIWQALEHAHLKKYVAGLDDGLEHECGEGGQNLSVGQRQLVCLGRSLLRKTKILILDEATAAVDLETDDLIQQTIRTEFADCTILTIAHRLNTIMDNDRVMVLDKGQISEFDSPQALLQNKKSIFYGMARDAGLV